MISFLKLILDQYINHWQIIYLYAIQTKNNKILNCALIE